MLGDVSACSTTTRCMSAHSPPPHCSPPDHSARAPPRASPQPYAAQRLLPPSAPRSRCHACPAHHIHTHTPPPRLLLTTRPSSVRAHRWQAGKQAIGAALLDPSSAKVGCLSCEAFELGPQTAALDLPGSDLSEADIALLAGVLSHNEALKSLDLSHIGLGSAAATSLCTALARNTALVEVRTAPP
jgi:hypothetical protein